MPLLKAFIHGTSVSAELNGPGPGPFVPIQGAPWSEVVGYTPGWGRAFRGTAGRSAYIHAAVPTPTLEDSRRVQLDKIYIFFISDSGCVMTDIGIWDGPDMIVSIPGLASTGDNLRNPREGINSFSIRTPPNTSILHTVNYGVGISMHFSFNVESGMHFSSIGCDFLY